MIASVEVAGWLWLAPLIAAAFQFRAVVHFHEHNSLPVRSPNWHQKYR